jgi:hypothetical protein
MKEQATEGTTLLTSSSSSSTKAMKTTTKTSVYSGNMHRSSLHAHYETGAYTKNQTFLEDEEYSRALDCIVKGCADVLLRDSEGRILIGYRNVEPAANGPWFIGGRIKVGDSVFEAARINVKRECKIDIEETRFEVVHTSTHVWAKRKQAPSENGTGDVIVVSTATITDEEKANVEMVNTEYDGYAWKTPEEVISGEEYHPALKNAVKAMSFNMRQNDLIAAVREGKSDGEIAKLAREAFAEK